MRMVPKLLKVDQAHVSGPQKGFIDFIFLEERDPGFLLEQV